MRLQDPLRLPLLVFAFKQTAAHSPIEANVERVFSVAGYLSDPCRHAEHLVDTVMATLNREALDPSIEAIRERLVCGCGLGFGLESVTNLIDFPVVQRARALSIHLDLDPHEP